MQTKRNLSIDEAASLLLAGDVVAIPTETVYGLAADARSDEAVSKIFTAKGRPSDNPLIVHIADENQLKDLVKGEISKQALKLVKTFWPGPLTIILPSSGFVSGLTTAGLETVAIRMPAHPVALELLRKIAIPIAAPSANVSGRPSPTTTSHVLDDLDGKIAGVLDGGACEFGLESTVIDMSTDVPIILRPGNISREMIESVIGLVEVSGAYEKVKPKSPGMKYRHYAPDAEVFVIDGSPEFFQNQIGQMQLDKKCVGVLCLDENLSKYQANFSLCCFDRGQKFYSALREFDALGVDVILCEFPMDAALRNRVLKASEERVIREVED